MEEIKLTYGTNHIGNMKKEIGDLQGYDTMALELIQNADDAEATIIKFDVCDDGLKVFNNAEFSACDLKSDDCTYHDPPCSFHAIKEVASGNKAKKAGNIGRFGIGFISVYQVTDEPVIRSSGKAMRLNPLGTASVSDLLEPTDGTSFFLPWASEESEIRSKLNQPIIYERMHDKVLNDIAKVGAKSLFFLENLQIIEILKNGKIIKKFTAKKEKNPISIVTECCISKSTSKENYLMFEDFVNVESLNIDLESDDAARNNKVEIAIPCDKARINANGGLIFAYLPTEQSTGSSIHINADFFPKSDRKGIILTGHSPLMNEWNFALLNFATEIIKNNLEELKDKLNYKTFSCLLSSICDKNEEIGFKSFQKRIREKVTDVECIYTYDKKWVKPTDAVLVYRKMKPLELKALSYLEFNIVHPDITREMRIIVDKRIALDSFIEKLKTATFSAVDKKLLQDLYFIANEFSLHEEKESDSMQILCKIVFILTSDEKYLSYIDDMYKLPPTVDIDDLPKAFPKYLLADKSIKKHEKLYSFFDELNFNSLGCELSCFIKTQKDAEEHIGVNLDSVKKFYSLLLKYKDSAKLPDDEKNFWKDIPFLFVQGNFYYAKDVKLPSDFIDPFRRYKIFDEKGLDKKIVKFLEKVFNLEEQKQKDYVVEHLAEDVDKEIAENDTINDFFYKRMLAELTREKNGVLRLRRKDEEEKIIDILKKIRLVKVEDGSMKTANECYFRSPLLAKLFGDDKGLWIDEARIPKKYKKLSRELFEKLGAKNDEKISIDDISKRIGDIVNEYPTLQNRKSIQEIIKFLIENDFNKSDIEKLSKKRWLPAVGNEEHWHVPDELYHPKDAEAFKSQVPILDFDKSKSRSSFWSWLKTRTEPSMDILIKHIEECQKGTEPLDYEIYKFMEELCVAGGDEAKSYIERLKEIACIYHAGSKRYLKPDNIFWYIPKEIFTYRYTMPDSLRKHEKLFELIGVKREPNIVDFAKIILEINEKSVIQGYLSDNERHLYFLCLGEINKAIKNIADYTFEAIELLKEQTSILTINSTFYYPDQIFICRHDDMKDHFEGRIDGYIVEEGYNLDNIKEILNKLGIQEITNAFHVEGLFDKNNSTNLPIFDNKISSKQFLDALSWELYQNGIEYRSVLEYLKEIKFYSIENLKVQYEFIPTGEIVNVTEEVFFDGKIVYLQEQAIDDFIWIPIFIAIFSKELADMGDKIRTIAGAASTIIEDPIKAEKYMKKLGYKPPPEETLNPDFSIPTIEHEHNLEDADESINLETHPKEDDRYFENNAKASSQKERKTGGWQGNTTESSRSYNRSGRGSSARNLTAIKQDRIVSYVNMDGDERGSVNENLDQETKDKIDEAAMKASIKSLENEGFEVTTYPKNQKGFDLTAIRGSEERIIEVKGSYHPWAGKGVSLSRHQIKKASEERENYWLYVVECATTNPKIYKIKNLFKRIGGILFDGKYKKFAEEE